MKFIIWGVGYRGTRLFNFLGPNLVEAFIDSNEKKVGTFYNNIEVISLEEYKKYYNNNWIIISPTRDKEIIEELEKNDVFQYTSLRELPSEYQGYANISFSKLYEDLLQIDGRELLIAGSNALGFIVYDLLNKRNRVSFLDDKIDGKQKKYLEDNGYEINNYENNKKIELFVCTDNLDSNLLKKFKKIVCINRWLEKKNRINIKIKEIKKINEKKKYCFIIATGPSLKMSDLELIKDNYLFSFGVNKIYDIRNNWKPDAFVVSDAGLLSQQIEEYKNYTVDYCFFSDSIPNIFSLQEEKKNVYIYPIVVTRKTESIPLFSSDPSKFVYGGATVTYVCIQLAIYMGFTEIYLLGVDCNYIENSMCNYFIESSKPDNIDHNVDVMIRSYKSARKYAENNRIKIYNATRGGKLEIFDRVDFDSLFVNKKFSPDKAKIHKRNM